MALSDPLGLQENDPEKIAQPDIPDYLGKESPLAFKGQPALPVTGAAAFGSPSAPAGPGGGAFPEGMGGGAAPGGFGQLAAKLLDSGGDLAKFFGGGADLGTRGETGGVSLSDELRSRGMGEFGASAGAGAAGSEGLGEGFLGGLGDLGAEGSLGADSLSGLMGGASFGEGVAGAGMEAAQYAGLLEAFQGGGWEGLMGQMPGFGLDPFTSFGIMGSIKSLWDPDNAFSLPFSNNERGSSVAHEIRTQMRDLPKIIGQLQAGAVDPSTLRGMSEDDLATLYGQARTAYGSTNGLAPMFGVSGRKEAGIQHPDLSALVDPMRQLMDQDFFNIFAAQDLLDQRGHQWSPDYERYGFGEAIHALANQGGLPTYDKGFTGLEPWDPYYKGHGLVDEQVWEQEGSTGNYVTRQRSANDPAEYLSAIGADPKLAETLGPLIDGVQPGKYLETLNQIFGLLNPDAANSTFGKFYATQQGDPGDGLRVSDGFQSGRPPAGLVADASGGSFGDVARAVTPGVPGEAIVNTGGQGMSPGGEGEEFGRDRLGVGEYA